MAKGKQSEIYVAQDYKASERCPHQLVIHQSRTLHVIPGSRLSRQQIQAPPGAANIQGIASHQSTDIAAHSTGLLLKTPPANGPDQTRVHLRHLHRIVSLGTNRFLHRSVTQLHTNRKL